MDLLPKVSGVNPNPGDKRKGTGSFARKSKRESDDGAADEHEKAAASEGELDPLLAELDRLRTMDPSLTESGAHRALMAVRAYTHPPGTLVPPVEPSSLPAAHDAEVPPTPETAAGSDANQP